MTTLTHAGVAAAAPPEDDPLARVRAQTAQLLEGTLDFDASAVLLRRLEEWATRTPGPEVASLLRGLLDDPRLAGRTWSGEPLRARLLRAQQALGYPWALEISPDDLALLPRRGDPRYGARAALLALATLALLWNASLAHLSDSVFGGPARETWAVLPLFFMLAIVHAGVSMVLAISFRPQWLMRTVGWLGLFAPLLTGQGVLDDSWNHALGNLVVAAACALPTVLTSLAARRLAPHARA